MLTVTSYKYAKSIFTIVTLGLLATPAVQAQEVLEEIIVTAQKREQDIQEVPISISKLTGDRLNARFAGGEDILALASAAPGLHVESSNGRLAPRFYMRGLGNADFTQAASQPVSVVFDEVPMEKVALKAFPLFDMGSIEVIRGPQGTLFGRNTTAGIVHIISRRPTEETEGYVHLLGGNLGTFNADAAIGGTLIEGTLMGRASFMTQNRSDWIDNEYTGTDLGGHSINAGRVQLLWTPSDNFTAWLMHQRQDTTGTTSIFRANVLNKGSNKLNSNYVRDEVWLDGGDGNRAALKSHGTTLKLDWDVSDDYTITSITSYQDVYDRFGRGDIDGGYGCLFTCGGIPSGPASSPYSPFNSPFVVNIDTGSDIFVKQFTQEFRFASNLEGPFNYQLGMFYFDDEFDGNAQAQSAGATEFATSSTSHIENTTWAIFGQGSYDVSDRLTITGGMRYTDDEKEALHVDYSGVVPTVPIRLTDDNLSWDLAVAYAMNDDSQVYGRIASGFRAPTIQDRIQDDVEVTTADSETILSYEIGYKALLDKIRFNVAAFYYTIDDMQLVAVGGSSNSTSLLNADEGVGYGVEFEIDYVVTDNLILSGGFGYNETEVKDDTLSVPGGPLVTILDPLDANGFARINGNPFQHAPKWTLNFELDYTYPLSSGSELFLFTDWKFKGETNDFLYESIEFVTDTQFEGGLRIGYRNIEKNYD
ncbi:MAG: TonB-dependent receptor, partial [Gammaproteobacteria bacterium]|nr:TonB-dependent receptor [Gammaproteobacteria bacterium]